MNRFKNEQVYRQVIVPIYALDRACEILKAEFNKTLINE